MNPMIALVIMTAAFVAITVCFGLLFSLINKWNATLIHRIFGWGGICVFGVVGVPVHELSHLILAVVFKHQVTNVSLFRPKRGKIDGILGYVRHSYRNTLYQKVGNFFIGAAPMICGTFLIQGMIGWVLEVPAFQKVVVTSTDDLLAYAIGVLRQAVSLFSTRNLENPWFWLILFAIVGIAVNMNMSPADLKNSAHGIFSLFLLTVFVAGILYVVCGLSFETMALAYLGVLLHYVAILLYGIIICSSILVALHIMAQFL